MALSVLEASQHRLTPASGSKRAGRAGAAAAMQQRRSPTRCQASTIKFAKYQGLGNDFILVRSVIGGERGRGTSMQAPLPRVCAAAAPAASARTARHAHWRAPPASCARPQVDNRHQAEPVLTPEQAAQLCDRNFGVGGDGVIFALPPTSAATDYAMRIYNSGVRCLRLQPACGDGGG